MDYVLFDHEAGARAIAIGEGDDALVNPDRPIVTRDYIDFATQGERTPDYLACYKLFGADDEIGPWGCGHAEITYRNSLLPVPDVASTSRWPIPTARS